MSNEKTRRTESPDKTTFFAMMGVFFTLFSLPAFYWAIYSFQNYRQATDHARVLSERTEPYLTAKEREERESLIRLNRSSAERKLLEAGLSGAGGLALCGIALFLFVKAGGARKRKNVYENLNSRAIPLPDAPIEVSYKKIHDALFGLVVLFFASMLALIVYQNLSSKFIGTTDAIVRSSIFAVPILLLLFAFSYLMIRAKRRAALFFDAAGIGRGDGRRFAWHEFRGTVTHTAFNQRTQNRYVWRVELVFAGGESAWLIPHRIKNAAKVFDYVARLPVAALKN